MEKNDNEDIVGYIGCIFLFSSFIPQTLKVITTNDVSNLSSLFLFLILMASLSLGIYAYQLCAYPILLANISVFSNNIVLLIVYLKKKKYVCRIKENNGILV